MKNLYLLICTLLVFFSTKAQDVIQSDRDALMALYNATDGPNWTDNTNWGSAEPVSSWYGIVVAGDRVVEINFYSNNLNGIIPAEIGNLSALVRLNMSFSNLTGIIPGEIGNLNALTELVLSGNKISGSIPTEIGVLNNLTMLDLYNNNLTDTIPAEIGDLTSLTILNLSENNLSGSIPTELGNLTDLIELKLNSNKLSGFIPSIIGNLTFINALWLFDNQLSGAIPTEIGNLTSLYEVNLSRNNLSGTIPTTIGNLTLISALWLSDNQLSGAIPIEIGTLTSLYELNLSQNKLSGPIPSEVGNLSSLNYLDLSFNELEGPIPSEIGNLISISGIHLSSNKLSGSIPDLSGLPMWSHLSLENNYFTFEAIEAGLAYDFTFEYNPQFNIQLTTNEVLATQGADVDIDISSISVNNPGGSNNRYQWFKDSVPITSLSSSPVHSLTGITMDDFGIYTCAVTNTVVNDLTLFSEEIYLNENVPMVFSSVTTTQSPENVFLGEMNQKIIRVEIYTTGSQSPLTVSEFSFNTNGSTNAIEDITNAHLIYTGYNDDLNNGVQFDGNVTANGGFSFTGNQELKQGANNFWLVYDISASATNGNFVDAECNLVSISSTDYIPTITSPVGNNVISMGDRAALMALYNATNGPNWRDNTNWGSTEPLDNWYGVFVENGRVIEIVLYSNSLKGNIPAEIEYLENIEYLFLPSNKLSGSIPPEIGMLTSLYELDLSENKLSDSIPSEIGNLTSLMGLYLSDNQLNGELPDLSGLTNLNLLLDKNYFTFEAIELAISIPSLVWFEYSPQLNFQLTTNEYVIEQGASIDIDISSISLHNLGGVNNRYQWFKNGVSISSLSSSPVLSLSSIGLGDYGPYVCQVTNIVAIDLTLYSEQVFIHETANTLPMIANPISDKTENIGFASLAVDLSNVFTDSDGDALSYSALSDNTGVAAVFVNGNTLTIAEIAAGTTQITVTASDGNGGSVDDVFLMNVNASGNNAPVVSNPILDKTENEGFGSLTLDLSTVFADANGDALSYTIFSSNTGVATVNMSGNTLTITEVAVGTTQITITASDGKGGSVNDVFLMNVNIAGNNAPVVSSPILDKTVNEGFGSLTEDLSIVFTDSDGDALSYTALSSNTGVATANVSGDTLTVTEVAVGTTDITITAIDGKGGAVEEVFLMEVIAAVNNAPVVSSPISDKMENAGFGSLTEDLSTVFTDADGDTLSYTVLSSNTGVATANVSGNILTVTEVAAGTTDITVTAIDGKGGLVNETFAFTINVSTSIERLNQVKIMVFPNPTSGIVYFESTNTQIQNIEIYDLAGTLLINKTDLEDNEVDLSGLSTGIYMINIRTDKESFTTRIVKE